MSSQVLLRKSLRRKNICLSRFLMQTFLGEKNATRMFISKEEKGAPGFKSGRNRTFSPFRANALFSNASKFWTLKR